MKEKKRRREEREKFFFFFFLLEKRQRRKEKKDGSERERESQSNLQGEERRVSFSRVLSFSLLCLCFFLVLDPPWTPTRSWRRLERAPTARWVDDLGDVFVRRRRRRRRSFVARIAFLLFLSLPPRPPPSRPLTHSLFSLFNHTLTPLQVYKAKEKSTGRLVALKKTRLEVREKKEKEEDSFRPQGVDSSLCPRPPPTRSSSSSATVAAAKAF